MKARIRLLITALMLVASAGVGQAKTIPFRVTSDPIGATVQLDGRVVGTTPLEIQIPDNWLHHGILKHLIKPMTMTVSKDGYVTKTYKITDGPYSISYEYESVYYQLYSNSWAVNLYKPVEFIPNSSARRPFTQPGNATSHGPAMGSPGAQTGAFANLLSWEQVVAGAMPAVVAIRTAAGAYGTGFFITDSGVVVTSRGVVASSTAATIITNQGESLNSVSIYVSPSRDLAFIKVVASGYPHLRLARSANIALGGEVVALGSPAIPVGVATLAGAITRGAVRAVSDTKNDGWLLQTDGPIDAGNTGGPLMNLRGEVIGVITTDIVGFSDGTFVETNGGPFQPDDSGKQVISARFAIMSGEVLDLLKEQFKIVP